jgi:serine/threonine protein phosphatase PrpC
MASQSVGPFWLNYLTDKPSNELESIQMSTLLYSDCVAVSQSPGQKALKRNKDQPCMEDTHIVRLPGKNSQNTCCPLFGVFDGHNGSVTSKWIAANIAGYIDESLQKHTQQEMSDAGIFAALKEAFIRMDKECPKDKSGTTATVATILNGALFVANVGDSRTMLNHNGKAVQLSQDADSSSPKYHDEIAARGGNFNGVDRVMSAENAFGGNGYSLPLASSIGDSENFPGITAEPEIIKYLLPNTAGAHNHCHLILASDGLTGITVDPRDRGIEIPIANTCQIVKRVQACATEGMSVDKIAEDLVAAAFLEAYSQDNITVICVDLSRIEY